MTLVIFLHGLGHNEIIFNKFTWCFHKQNYYIFYRHANIQRTYEIIFVRHVLYNGMKIQNYLLLGSFSLSCTIFLYL
jgi:hypothetical protein